MNNVTMTKEEFGKAIADISLELTKQNQSELGWIYSETRQVKGYEGNNRDELQSRVDHVVGGVSIVYLFALLEAHVEVPLWSKGEENLKKRFYAYRHIRNTIAHGFDGSRAERYDTEFDNIMSSNNPINGVISYTEHKIILDSHVAQDFQTFLPGYLASIMENHYGHGSTVTV